MTMTAVTWWLGRRRQAYLLVALAVIWFYVLVSGFPVSVLRAAIMGSVFLAAVALGLEYSPVSGVERSSDGWNKSKSPGTDILPA